MVCLCVFVSSRYRVLLRNFCALKKLCVTMVSLCYQLPIHIRGCHPPPTLGFPEIVVRRMPTWSVSCDNIPLMWLFSLNLAYNWRPNMASGRKTQQLSTRVQPTFLTAEHLQTLPRQKPADSPETYNKLKSWESPFLFYLIKHVFIFSGDKMSTEKVVMFLIRWSF